MTAGDPERRDVATLRIISSHRETTCALDRSELSLGRSGENDIRVDADVVSNVHARLVREGPTYRFVQLGETNPTLLRGVPIDNYLLHHGDRLEIAPGTPDGVTLVFDLLLTLGGQTMGMTRPFKAGDQAMAAAVERLPLPTSGRVTIGRSSENDLVLLSLSVSRAHARLDVDDHTVTLTDVGSANGTFVNGVACTARRLSEGDIVRIGPCKLVYRDGAIEHHDDSRAVRLDVHDLTKVVGGKTLLDGITFSIRPGELVAIAGTSGAGKSTLLDALNGMRPATSGRVLVNGADLYSAYDALRPLIGYVPQATILPMHLSVRRALTYVARLRLPPDVSAADAGSRVDEVMRQLQIDQRSDVRIGQLSGGQQKRASIAAELISEPGLFYLDEPTSGLDPGLTRRVTAITRELASAGSTVIVISHDVESLSDADRIIFLAGGGRVVFIGTPREALDFFGVADIAEIYPHAEAEDSAELRARFVQSEQYRESVAPGLVQRVEADEEGASARAIAWDPFGFIATSTREGASAWRQFSITTTRYAESMINDRRNVGLLLLQAPIIAFFLALVAKATDFEPPPAEAIAQAATLGVPAAKLAAPLAMMLAATATWFGAINAAREIVKELPILLREQLAGLRTIPYLASKVVVLLFLCLVQITILLGIVAAKVDLPSSGAITWAPLEMWITLILASIASLGLGLVISASVSNPDRAQSLVPIVLIPQLIFIGGPGTGVVGKWLSYLTVTHWASEALKISADIPYQQEVGGYGATDLLLHWLALIVMAVALLTLAGWLIARKRSA